MAPDLKARAPRENRTGSTGATCSFWRAAAEADQRGPGNCSQDAVEQWKTTLLCTMVTVSALRPGILESTKILAEGAGSGQGRAVWCAHALRACSVLRNVVETMLCSLL